MFVSVLLFNPSPLHSPSLSPSPVIHHKDHNLCDSDQEVSEIRDCVVFIVHSGEVHHVQTLHVVVKVVQEWDRGAAGLSSANRDLEGGRNN